MAESLVAWPWRTNVSCTGLLAGVTALKLVLRAVGKLLRALQRPLGRFCGLSIHSLTIKADQP